MLANLEERRVLRCEGAWHTGMPELVLMPAPVTTTTFLDFDRQSAMSWSKSPDSGVTCAVGILRKSRGSQGSLVDAVQHTRAAIQWQQHPRTACMRLPSRRYKWPCLFPPGFAYFLGLLVLKSGQREPSVGGGTLVGFGDE